MLGTFGWPITEASLARAIRENQTNAARPKWQSKAKALMGTGYIFDCVGLIKALLWGWIGDASKSYGGSSYKSNGVPDIGADRMIQLCKGASATGWSCMAVGEVVWMPGHIGVYVGNGLAVECTPSFKGGVQITAVGNIGAKAGYSTRKWSKHGKLPYVTYDASPSAPVTTDGSISLGDIVVFSGGLHYPSASAAKGTAVAAGPAKVTAISRGSKHPYHVVHTDKSSAVYGWVDASAIGKTASPLKRYKVTAGSGLNVRAGAGTNFIKNCVLPCGSVVEVDKTSNGWAHIPSKDGWASMQYLQEV